jgi:hypothetical protein
LLTQPPRAVPARDRLPWSSRSLEHTTPGDPFHPPRPQSRSRKGEGRQTPTGAVLRVLAPLDGSGRARGTHEPLAEPVVRRGAPTLCGLVSCRSRPWSRPSELSLLEEPYPLSRASCFLAGSRSTAQRRGTILGFRGPFRRSRRPLATAGPKARRTGRPGRRFPGVARRRTSRVAALVYDVSSLIGRARRTRRPARPLRSFAPLESPFSRRPIPWPGHGRPVGALLGFFCPPRPPCGSRRVHSPLESAPATRGLGLRDDERGRDEPVPRAPRERTPLAMHFARFSLRPWGLEPTVRRRVRPIEPFTSPTSSDPARRRFREAPTRRSPVPSEAAWEACAPSAHLIDETCCPRPLAAAPRASLVLRPRAAARGHVGGPRRRSISVR